NERRASREAEALSTSFATGHEARAACISSSAERALIASVMRLASSPTTGFAARLCGMGGLLIGRRGFGDHDPLDEGQQALNRLVRRPVMPPLDAVHGRL